jgi:hypothetical protein
LMFGLCLSQVLLSKWESFEYYGDRIPIDQIPTYQIPKCLLGFTFLCVVGGGGGG